MPSMANIVVKKNDGTTDITYSALTPSAGDKVAAVWTALTVAVTAAFRPLFRMRAQSNGDATTRRVTTSYVYPVTATENTVLVLKGKCIAETTWSIPQNLPDADIAEFVSQYANLNASVLAKDCVKVGYAPT